MEKNLNLQEFEIEKIDLKNSFGGGYGSPVGIKFGDQVWFGPTSGYIDDSGMHPDTPADWTEITFGNGSYF